MLSSAFPVRAAEGERVLILDPGHGGADGGAVAADGTLESEINLAVALKLRAVAQLFGETVVLTRESEALDYPPEMGTIRAKKVWDQKQRVALINAAENAVLISIHQNNFPDARPSGTQVFYGKAETSKAFGELMHQSLIEQLCPENRRVAAPIARSIYLMQQVNCPAVLVECGFLSNAQELEKLKSESYQIKLALILTAAYLTAFEPE